VDDPADAALGGVVRDDDRDRGVAAQALRYSEACPEAFGRPGARGYRVRHPGYSGVYLVSSVGANYMYEI
jgi:hypothetical protein